LPDENLNESSYGENSHDTNLLFLVALDGRLLVVDKSALYCLTQSAELDAGK
jgi:hypothetical protein